MDTFEFEAATIVVADTYMELGDQRFEFRNDAQRQDAVNRIREAQSHCTSGDIVFDAVRELVA